MVILNGTGRFRPTCDDAFLTVELADGRRITTPLWWYPRLVKAAPAQRANVEPSRFGVHWEEVDEDLSVDGMLRGAKAPGAIPPGSFTPEV
jgi:hypothetical protein